MRCDTAAVCDIRIDQAHHTKGVAASTLALARVLNCSNSVSATGGRNMCDTIYLMADASVRTTKHSHACRKNRIKGSWMVLGIPTVFLDTHTTLQIRLRTS